MGEEQQNHRQNVIDAINRLNDCDNQIFAKAITLLMSKEWKEIDAAFDIGEQYSFTLTQLETAEDQNVLLLASLIKEIRQTINSLQNLNAISDEELDHAE
jgi:hypothetical protein